MLSAVVSTCGPHFISGSCAPCIAHQRVTRMASGAWSCSVSAVLSQSAAWVSNMCTDHCKHRTTCMHVTAGAPPGGWLLLLTCCWPGLAGKAGCSDTCCCDTDCMQHVHHRDAHGARQGLWVPCGTCMRGGTMRTFVCLHSHTQAYSCLTGASVLPAVRGLTDTVALWPRQQHCRPRRRGVLSVAGWHGPHAGSVRCKDARWFVG
jgi:hypothetical protein